MDLPDKHIARYYTLESLQKEECLKNETAHELIDTLSFWDKYISPDSFEGVLEYVARLCAADEMVYSQDNYVNTAKSRINTQQLWRWQTQVQSMALAALLVLVLTLTVSISTFTVVVAFFTSIGYGAYRVWCIESTLNDIRKIPNEIRTGLRLKLEDVREDLIKQLLSPKKWERGDILVGNNFTAANIVLSVHTKDNLVTVARATDVGDLLLEAIRNSHLNCNGALQAESVSDYYLSGVNEDPDYLERSTDSAVQMTEEQLQFWNNHIGDVTVETIEIQPWLNYAGVFYQQGLEKHTLVNARLFRKAWNEHPELFLSKEE